MLMLRDLLYAAISHQQPVTYYDNMNILYEWLMLRDLLYAAISHQQPVTYYDNMNV